MIILAFSESYNYTKFAWMNNKMIACEINLKSIKFLPFLGIVWMTLTAASNFSFAVAAMLISQHCGSEGQGCLSMALFDFLKT